MVQPDISVGFKWPLMVPTVSAHPVSPFLGSILYLPKSCFSFLMALDGINTEAWVPACIRRYTVILILPSEMQKWRWLLTTGAYLHFSVYLLHVLTSVAFLTWRPPLERSFSPLLPRSSPWLLKLEQSSLPAPSTAALSVHHLYLVLMRPSSCSMLYILTSTSIQLQFLVEKDCALFIFLPFNVPWTLSPLSDKWSASVLSQWVACLFFPHCVLQGASMLALTMFNLLILLLCG